MSKEVPKPYDNEVDFEIIPDKEKVIEKFDSKVSGNYNYSNYKEIENAYQDTDEESEIYEMSEDSDILVNDVEIYNNNELHPYLVKKNKNQVKDYVEMVEKSSVNKNYEKGNKILLVISLLVIVYLLYLNFLT